MNDEVYAPYNFVPFSDTVLEYPYKTPPAYGDIRTDLLTGEIDVTLRAVTPVCIGNGDSQPPDFFRDPAGHYAIPGSSFRGLIRENMQILGHGRIVTEQDRDIAANDGHSMPVKGLAPVHKQKKLDMVSGIMGYANLDLGCLNRKLQPQKSTRRSRVSFGDLRLQGQARPMEAFQLRLNTPKPTRSANYTIDRGEAGVAPRGYKQYWLKPEVRADMRARNGSAMNAMPVGACFRGIIAFRNLYPAELGLLLWALVLEEGCFQPIGRGKPYGYGRMQLQLNSLQLLDAKALYCPNGLSSGLVPATNRCRAFIQTFQKLSQEKLGEKWNCNLEDFFYIRSTERTDGYMPAGAWQPEGARLPTIAEIRANIHRPELEPKPERASEPEDPEQYRRSLEALRAKFGGISAGGARTAPKRKKKGRK